MFPDFISLSFFTLALTVVICLCLILHLETALAKATKYVNY